MYRTAIATLIFCFLSISAQAKALKVVADIGPIHSLISIVTQGITSPNLIISPGESPHAFSLRPLAASHIQDADIIFWVGGQLTPSLESSLDKLNPDVLKIELIKAANITLFKFRERPIFRNDEHEGHDDHDEHEGHDHSPNSVDPHIWLSPKNAIIFLNIIAAELTKLDPANRDAYLRNAEAGEKKITALSSNLSSEFNSTKLLNFFVFHDAYQYFEKEFGINPLGSLLSSSAESGSLSRMMTIQEYVKANEISCYFIEPEFRQELVDRVSEGMDTQTIVLDPLGSNLNLGTNMYFNLLQEVGNAFLSCRE